jgi:formylglycine-generating enzyme required for sulfatase activity
LDARIEQVVATPDNQEDRLAELLALVKRKEATAERVEQMRLKAELARQTRLAEIARQKANEEVERKVAFLADYDKFNAIVASDLANERIKALAWKELRNTWKLPDDLAIGRKLIWEDGAVRPLDAETPVLAEPSTAPAQVSGAVGHSVTLLDVGIELMPIPAGKFLMGSPNGEKDRAADEDQVEVTIRKAFWLGRFEVTQEQWRSVIGNNPSHFSASGDDRPVEQVSWNDVQEFCKQLNKRTVGKRPSGFIYRLPTEAEWEYACRAGAASAHHFGAGIREELANLAGSRMSTAKVGGYLPNAWGLHDMHGNVYEWCLDWYGNYSSVPVTDPRGAPHGENRVLRGGGWEDRHAYARAAARHKNRVDFRHKDLGFRLALAPDFNADHALDGYAEMQNRRKGKPIPRSQSKPLSLEEGSLNGQQLDRENWTVTVKPGQDIQGSVRCTLINRMNTEIVRFGYTWTWGDRKKALHSVKSRIPRGTSTYVANVAITAPQVPGVYYLIFAFAGEHSMEQVFSRTNWTVRGVKWNDGNDLVDLREADLVFAHEQGYVDEWPFLHRDGYRKATIPVLPIRVRVE